MSAGENIVVRYFGSYEVETVRLFYSLTTYKNVEGVKREDEIVAAFEGDRIVGIFRLCKENGVNILRGFNVLKGYQGKGIGSLMLRRFEHELVGRTCYLICKKGLNKFYATSGFESVGSNGSDFLIERMVSYKNDELNILVRQVN